MYFKNVYFIIFYFKTVAQSVLKLFGKKYMYFIKRKFPNWLVYCLSLFFYYLGLPSSFLSAVPSLLQTLTTTWMSSDTRPHVSRREVVPSRTHNDPLLLYWLHQCLFSQVWVSTSLSPFLALYVASTLALAYPSDLSF